MKLLITILTSFNEYILFETYKSIENQITNFEYEIMIIVNSLNKEYYNDVKNKFKDINIKIIETKSNGKPGMGHNSCIEYFKNTTNIDYLMIIDGDDFLYPWALEQLDKILIYNPDIIVGGNEDTISNFGELYKKNISIDLNHKYYLNIEPNILIKKSYKLGNKGTPYRLVLMNKKIFDYNIDKYYCTDCKVFDDYLFYLHILNLYYTTDINIYFISLKNIYIYYKAHISSVCYENSINCTDDLNILENDFPILKKLSNIINFKLPTLYISNINNDIIKYKYETNLNINYNENDFFKSEQFKLNYNFMIKLSDKLYNSTLNFIEEKIKILDILDIKIKQKLYFLLENYLLNNIYESHIITNLIIISNNINYINIDIIDIIISNININELYDLNYIDYYENKMYIICLLKLKYILKTQKIDYINSIYYYINMIYNKCNIISSEKQENININIYKKTIVFLDCMDIDYITTTPYIKGLGGTQLSYIYLGLELTNKYNIIILNKRKDDSIILDNNIYFVNYNTINDMLIYINNIHPNIIIYNFIDFGKILKENIKNDILLYMYEHITIYSYFKLKQTQDYYNYYDKLIFVSNNQKNEYMKYIKLNNDKCFIQYNGLSPIFYNNNIKNNILDKKELSIIYISNPQRGLENFLYIFPILQKIYPNLTLKIYSSLNMYDIDDLDELNILYNKFINMKGVIYNKTISQNQLVEELNKSLLFIYPTNMTETFCNCMIEALSAGCYVISNNIGALKEIAYPYGYFIDININNTIPPYNFLNINYIDELIKVSSNVINDYNNKSLKLEKHLQNQIKYIKNKYKWNNNIF